jgi:exodeoxyribonuclease VII small subunit
MTNTGFEKALADLEEVVAKLEKGGTPLNESLAFFEKGVKLARFLRAELDKAERKVEILLKDEKGAVRAEDFELGDEEDKKVEVKVKVKAKAKKEEGGNEDDEAGSGGADSVDEGDTGDEGDKGGKLF